MKMRSPENRIREVRNSERKELGEEEAQGRRK